MRTPSMVSTHCTYICYNHVWVYYTPPFFFSMDGFRVVRLEDVLSHLDILISATGESSLEIKYVLTSLSHAQKQKCIQYCL